MHWKWTRWQYTYYIVVGFLQLWKLSDNLSQQEVAFNGPRAVSGPGRVILSKCAFLTKVGLSGPHMKKANLPSFVINFFWEFHFCFVHNIFHWKNFECLRIFGVRVRWGGPNEKAALVDSDQKITPSSLPSHILFFLFAFKCSKNHSDICFQYPGETKQWRAVVFGVCQFTN